MKILLAGDSTVAACPATETPMSGWGAHLGAPLNARLACALLASGRRTYDDPPLVVPVVNVAKGGATTASHRAEGLWAALLEQAAPGDGVVLQFGHNDQKLPQLAAWGGYRDNLDRFVTEAEDADCWVVLCTPVLRRRPPDDPPGLAVDHGEYPEAVRELAAARGTGLIDLTALTRALHDRLGHNGSAALFTRFAPGVHPLYPDGIADDTHYCVDGAARVADLVAEHLVPMVLAHLAIPSAQP